MVNSTSKGERYNLLRIASGKEKGCRICTLGGFNRDVTTSYNNLWAKTSAMDNTITYLTANTTLYVSSTSVADTTQSIQVTGVDSNYNDVVAIAALNGQSQVALSNDIYRVFDSRVIGTTDPAGDIYIAESDTLTGGVPDTSSKIKCAIEQGYNIGATGTLTISKGIKAIAISQRFNGDSAKKTTYQLRARFPGNIWWTFAEFVLTVDALEYDYDFNIPLPAGTDVEVLAKVNSSTEQVISNWTFVCVEE